jgi:hypothetical protein
MSHFLAVALSMPSVIYTVLLGACLVYWVFVMVGAARVELFGEGVAEGAAKGLLDGAGEGGHHADGSSSHDGAGHGDAEHGDADHGVLAGILSALRLRSAPATVVLSMLVLLSWMFCVMIVQTADAMFDGRALGFAKVLALLISPLLALPLTSLGVRPLARVFVPPKAVAHADLVGKTCTIRTGSVTDRFGEAVLEDGGAGLVVRVRVEHGEKLSRGDVAVLLGYDEQAQEYIVAPMDPTDEVHEEPSRPGRR